MSGATSAAAVRLQTLATLHPVRFLVLLAGCTLSAACAPPRPALRAAPTSDRLPPGTWTGGLAPMNHPDRVTPLTYVVGYDGDALTVRLGSAGSLVTARNVEVRGDTLSFAFDEPEEGVPLRCGLGADGRGGFAGRCADASGKWAWFTMTPPAE